MFATDGKSRLKTTSNYIDNTALWRKIAQLAENTNTPVYLVGGAVRDSLMGMEAQDCDFLTLSKAVEFAEIIQRELSGSKIVTFPRFNAAFFFAGAYKLEFAEPRIAWEGLPESEIVRLDLGARDFTIDAMAVKLFQDDRLEVIDPYKGREDLQQGILRTPGAPDDALSDDPLRIIRAFRFAARFKLEIAPELLDAIRRSSGQLERVAGERIGEELWKIMELPHPSAALKPMFDQGVLKVILPEIAALAGVEKHGYHHHKDIFLHTLKVVDNAAKSGADTVTRFAALLHDVAKPSTRRFDPEQGYTFYGHEDVGARMAGGIGRKLRYSAERIKLIQKLTKLHMRPVNLVSAEVTDSAIRRLMTEAGDDLERQLLLCRADITSGDPRKVKLYLENFDRMYQRMQEVEEKDKMRAFQSPVRGDEIMEICSLPPCPMVGKIKKALESAILEGIIPNEYEAAKTYLLENMGKWMEESR